MDRNKLKQYTHNQADRLRPSDPLYKQWIFRYTFLEVEKDLGMLGDITSDILFSDNAIGSATIRAHEPGIAAGLQEIEYFLLTSASEFKPRVSDISVSFLKNDGDHLKRNDAILTMKGSVKDLLKVERTVLNVIGRMSGIATVTHNIAEKAPNILVTPTRKTLWGLLDKRACVIGGGGTHRLNLEDAILVKNNHQAVFGASLVPLLTRIFERKPQARFIEIEVNTVDAAIVAANTYSEWKEKHSYLPPFCIMFDNMQPVDIRNAAGMIAKEKQYAAILLEASGGITAKNIAEYAKTNVDIISVGALTHSAPMLDISMEIP